MATTEFNPFDEADTRQAEAEKAALEAGEKIYAAQQEDKARVFEQREAESEPLAGKFKTPEELEKAYLELQKKLGEKTPETEEEAPEGQEEAPEEAPEEEAPAEEESEIAKSLRDFSKEYEENGSLSEETIEALGEMDSKQLVKEYLRLYQENAAEAQKAQKAQVDEAAILQSVGGVEAYQELVGWAAENLAAEEINDFNGVVNSGNPVAIKFAVEALKSRRQSVDGYEAPLVTGRKASVAKDRFRSNAELSRAIADPRYQTDPAYRQDVADKLARSGDLL